MEDTQFDHVIMGTPVWSHGAIIGLTGNICSKSILEK
jgi:hypothetical protein